VTILVITHRLSTIRAADLIHVVAGGRVVESGDWQELLARGGHFAALCAAQGIEPGAELARRRPGGERPEDSPQAVAIPAIADIAP
jgi:ABC-type glutathione transport system ATPase component